MAWFVVGGSGGKRGAVGVAASCRRETFIGGADDAGRPLLRAAAGQNLPRRQVASARHGHARRTAQQRFFFHHHHHHILTVDIIVQLVLFDEVT